MKPEKQLYQWDVNQYLTGINPAAQYVDYTIGNDVIRLETDGTRCRIPDEFLQTYGGKTCYERYPDGTFRAYSFSVLYAPKPPDYVYTPEERTTFEALTARVDSAIDEIKRRADSGEFTPVKGVDYFTDAEKNELMESVSTGAIGEFRKVVDTATTEYNANAAEKLEAYNQNHTAKVAEYNQNAETKTAEFDANAAALQTEVDRLRGECDQLAAENRKQENRISALMKLNKGQTYDILPEEGETASRTAPSGAKYVSVDNVGGKSIVWNQLANVLPNETRNGLAYSTDNGKISITGTVQGAPAYGQFALTQYSNFKRDGRKYLILFSQTLDVGVSGYDHASRNAFFFSQTRGTNWNGYVFLYVNEGETVSVSNLSLNVFDITQMFGSTIADYIYSLEQSQAGAGVAWFKKLFPKDYYPYSEPAIISSQTDRVDVARADGTTSQQITTGFPVLKSAGSVYDYIDINEGKLYRRVGAVDIGTFNWDNFVYGESTAFRSYDYTGKKPPGSTHKANIMCAEYETVSAAEIYDSTKDKCIAVHNGMVGLLITDSSYTDVESFKQAMQGVMLYYELAEPVIDDITIPTELTDWLDVEAGGSVTFHDADESKQLPVPNAVSWVRKLNEVE